MAHIESITNLLEKLHQKATYIACKATGYTLKDIKYIYFDEGGGIIVLFSFYIRDEPDETDEVYISEDDFSDVDKGAERIKSLRLDYQQREAERKQKEDDKRKANLLAEEKRKYLELKAKFEQL